jgi:succinate dehydrogenase / fumarate reductase, membrane anchor subunit
MTQLSAKPQGVWAWILQRLTAVLLVFFLGAHLTVLHYVPENMNINFLGVAARFKGVLYIIIDSGLLAVAVYHALNGVRNVLFDFVVNDGKRRALSLVLVLVGIVYLIWGAYALTFFVK